MNVQSHAVPRAVEVALHATIDHPGLIAGLLESITNALVDDGPVGAVADFGAAAAAKDTAIASVINPYRTNFI